MVFYVFKDYYGLLGCFSGFLLLNGLVQDKVNTRFLSFYFLIYLFIPFLNISNYRGTVTINTLAWYCIVQFTILLIFQIFESPPSRFRVKTYLVATNDTQLLFYGHMLFVWGLVAYVYMTIGPIVIRQDLRFTIPPIIEYLIKSGLIIPLVWLYSANLKLDLRTIVLRFLLPITPSLLIGSRGTFIMILISLFISLFLFKKLKSQVYLKRFKWLFSWSRTVVTLGVLIGVFALYSGFYIRRDGKDLITPDELIREYSFSAQGNLVMGILPIYLNFRETVGITNRIIEERVTNTYSPYPLFFAELVTILPGHQEAPGIILAQQVYSAQGSDEKYSLTPGIVGGLFMDYGYYSLLFIAALTGIVVYLFNLGRMDIRYILIYSFTIVQFLHLYHRGFLKIEYLFPYLILFVYLKTTRTRKVPALISKEKARLKL